MLPNAAAALLSTAEKNYFEQTAQLMNNYAQQTGIAIQSDRTPPKSLFMSVRCVRTVGRVATESGVTDLQVGHDYHMRQKDAQLLLSQGILVQLDED